MVNDRQWVMADSGECQIMDGDRQWCMVDNAWYTLMTLVNDK